MERYKSSVDTESKGFRENYEHNLGKCEELQDRLEEWQAQGKARRMKAAIGSGKMLGRERLSLMLDPDTPFLEIGALAGYAQDGYGMGNTSVGGIGVVSNTEIVLLTNIPTVGSGAMNRVNGIKWQRCSEMSMSNQLPFVQMLETGGADLSEAFDVFHTAPNPFHRLANRSKMRVPSICMVFGTCIAGGAYMAGMSDYVIMIKNQSHLALAGRPLVKVATGEDATDQELGGASMHSRISGVSDFLVNNEFEAIMQAREIIATWNYQKKTVFPSTLSCKIEEPYYDPQELLGIISKQHTTFFDVREVIARIVDGSRFAVFKPDYGSTLVCATATIHGYPVGILGNNGVLFHQTAQKGAHFINLCNQNGVPIIFMHNVTGFMVGKKYEEAGIIKWGSQMVNAAANCVVPKITLMIGASFGAANFAMCGRGYNPRFIFAYPNAKCAVMGPDQLAGVMDILAREGAAKKGRKVDDEKLEMIKGMTKNKIEEEMDAYYMTSHGKDDGIIDPRDTRAVIGMCLSATCNTVIEKDFITGVSRL